MQLSTRHLWRRTVTLTIAVGLLLKSLVARGFVLSPQPPNCNRCNTARWLLPPTTGNNDDSVGISETPSTVEIHGLARWLVGRMRSHLLTSLEDEQDYTLSTVSSIVDATANATTLEADQVLQEPGQWALENDEKSLPRDFFFASDIHQHNNNMTVLLDESVRTVLNATGPIDTTMPKARNATNDSSLDTPNNKEITTSSPSTFTLTKTIPNPLGNTVQPNVAVAPTDQRQPDKEEGDESAVAPVQKIEPQTSPVENVVSDETDQQLRRRSADIVHSFPTHDFEPAPFALARNPHLQTILGAVRRQEHSYLPTVGNTALDRFVYDRRQCVATPDGDFFQVDWKYAPHSDNSSTPIVVLCHGLESNSNSPLVKDMALALNDHDMDIVATNCRGSGGDMCRTRVGYHLGFTEDLTTMLDYLRDTRPQAPILMSGFSMGANHITQLLAQLGSEAYTKYNIRGAAVNALPTDLVQCQETLDRKGSFDWNVYGKGLLKSLQQRTLQSMESGVNYDFTKDDLLACQSLVDFDNLVVCSSYDFENARDYHTRCTSSEQVLDRVMVPQLIVQARDDPFLAGCPQPSNDPDRPVRFQYTDHGGHCGYIFHSEESDRRTYGWLPNQLARFLTHVLEHQDESENERETSLALRQDARKQQAAKITHEFKPRTFEPAWYGTNPHLQTILGAVKRNETMYTNPLFPTFIWKVPSDDDNNPDIPFQWDKRQRMETPDGDFFDVDWKTCQRVNKSESQVPVVLICHGLQSDSSSPLVQDMAKAYNAIGMDAACINFRGCSGVVNRTPVGYHLGFTTDLRQMIDSINHEFPKRRIYLSGFSLGANVVTNCLAELGDEAYHRNICGAAVNAVPFDMTKANLNLNDHGLTKSIYGQRLLDSMVDRIENSYDTIDFDFPLEQVYQCKTIRDMEDLVIAPVFGFEDAWDYYEQTSTRHKLDRVAVPQLIVQAKDDPFFYGQTNPAGDDIRLPLRIHYTKHGGHCGYVFHSTAAQDNDNDNDDAMDKTSSWMPTELARFLSHVENNLYRLEVE